MQNQQISEEIYITNSEGDTYLFEVRETRGLVSLSFGDRFNITVSKDDAFEIIDSLTLVLAEMRMT